MTLIVSLWLLSSACSPNYSRRRHHRHAEVNADDPSDVGTNQNRKERRQGMNLQLTSQIRQSWQVTEHLEIGEHGISSPDNRPLSDHESRLIPLVLRQVNLLTSCDSVRSLRYTWPERA
jgi:hypothetical protein